MGVLSGSTPVEGKEGKRKEGKESGLGRWRRWAVMPSQKRLQPTLQGFLKLGWSFRDNLVLYYINYINRYNFLIYMNILYKLWWG